MSELTITVIRLALLVLLWVFIFSVVGVLRGDLYGTRVITRTAKRATRPSPTAREGDGAGRQPDRRPAERPARRGPQHLTVVEGSMRGTSIPLRDNLLIGRNPECTLSLGDDFASGRHARIHQRDGGWFVDDLGSTNGTFLGNQRVEQSARVDTGSRIRIGRTVLELRK